MNMNDAPQTAESTSSISSVRRLIRVFNAGRARVRNEAGSSSFLVSLAASVDCRRTADPPRARAHRRRVRANPGAARPRAEPLRARGLLAALVGALRLQALGAAAAAAPARAASACSRGPGENAGVLDLGDGEAVAFKVESHNHPSAVEPFQGAATGVGGILRDIIAMGARPVALLDGLRFGAPDARVPARGRRDRRLRQLGRRADGRRRDRLRRGLRRQLPRERDVRRAAPGLAGDAREGVRAPGTCSCSSAPRPGATGSAARPCSRARSSARTPRRSGPPCRSATPFTGKRPDRGLGRAGRARPGRVAPGLRRGRVSPPRSRRWPARRGRRRPPRPRAAPRARPRALGDHDLGVPGADGRGRRPGRLAEVEEVCDRWELHHAVIGEVTRDGLPARALGRRGRRRDPRPRSSPTSVRATRSSRRPQPVPRAAPRRAVRSAKAGSTSSTTSWSARGRSAARARRGRAAAAAVVPRPRRLAPGPGARASSTRSAPGSQAVLGAARNVACAGGEPIGLTDCLNFGNPEKPEIGWELAQAIEGIAQAAEALGDPGRLGQRLALQRDRRPRDPADAGRRLRRPRRRTCAAIPGRWRAGDAVLLAAVPEGELDGGGRADPLPLAVGAAALARARRRLGRARRPRSTRPPPGAATADVALPPEPGDGARDRRLRARRTSPRLGACGPDPDRRSWPGDVRRLRHPRPRPRRRARHALRPARAPAPRPGVGRDRRLRPRAA